MITMKTEPGEMLKGGEIIKLQIFESICQLWRERMPDKWKETLLIPIYKKGESTICENYI